ncbi:Leucine-rich_repeat [Hexamita inflata]|uniref:Leucine-rich repeat n=1 Tax=Hexamita inflata TaxID=28002 RepID=A0AA86VA88_9EUKA|nr:Leucine-rich repeat [Hexamita inflata]
MNLEQLVLNDNFISDFNNFEQFKTEQRVPTPIQVLFSNKLKQIHFQEELNEQMKGKQFKVKRKQNDFTNQINKMVQKILIEAVARSETVQSLFSKICVEETQ